ncbi:MAG: nitrous oxide reductase accessory protein NosL [Acidovorax sp.]|nr:nitrous oxide reductase accessory protein NosL [Acidovorax sp.]
MTTPTYRCACARHTRRRLLGWALAAPLGMGLAGLAGCSDRTGTDSAHAAAPTDFDRATSCELDGMLLADYPGPKAQIHYTGQSRPVFFCDTVELFNTLLAGEQVRAVAAVYVQDMGQADWEAPRGHWIDARSAVYVSGSRRHGSMGPTLASFASPEAATRFTTEHGGRVLRFAEITPEMTDLSGGALHDTRM